MKTESAVNGWVKSNVSLVGKVVVITGANTGIGLETAIHLCKAGAKVYLACRNTEKGETAKKRIILESKCTTENAIVKKIDLASFDSVRKFAKSFNEEEERLDILINNAGVMLCPPTTTEDGMELQFQTNHLSHFLLTNLLTDKLKKSAPSRVVNVSSLGHIFSLGLNWADLNHAKKYSQIKTYCDSKLMNILFTKELNKLLQGTGVTANCLHPGIIRSDLWNHFYDKDRAYWRRMVDYVTMPIREIFWKSVKQGAQTTIYCAIAPELEDVGGKYLSECAYGWESPLAKNEADARKLWLVSEQITGLVGPAKLSEFETKSKPNEIISC